MEEVKVTGETRDVRIKRLYMRSIRRGIKEMDLILGAYAGADLGRLSPEMLDVYDDMLSENDHDLYQWVTGQTAAPARFAPLISDIAAFKTGQ